MTEEQILGATVGARRVHDGPVQLAEYELAMRTWRYVQNYADAKGDLVEEIIARARHETRRDETVQRPSPKAYDGEDSREGP